MSRKTFFKSRKDGNHDDIKKALENMGAVVLNVHALPNCFDMLVFYEGTIYPFEVKMKGKKLTKGEIEFKNKIEAVGCKYYVVYSVDEAIQLMLL